MQDFPKGRRQTENFNNESNFYNTFKMWKRDSIQLFVDQGGGKSWILSLPDTDL